MFKTSLLNQQRLPLVVEPELVGAQPAATVETLIELYQSREDFFRERL